MLVTKKGKEWNGSCCVRLQNQALANRVRQRLRPPSLWITMAHPLPLGTCTESTWIQIILLVVCCFFLTLRKHNSIVAAEKPNRRSGFHSRLWIESRITTPESRIYYMYHEKQQIAISCIIKAQDGILENSNSKSKGNNSLDRPGAIFMAWIVKQR